jgi:hypothetical protein
MGAALVSCDDVDQRKCKQRESIFMDGFIRVSHHSQWKKDTDWLVVG